MNCLNCEKDHICCSKFGVTLSKEEVSEFAHKKIVPLTENKKILGYVFVLLKNDKTGKCVYQNDNGMCDIYEQRPIACRRFDCETRFR